MRAAALDLGQRGAWPAAGDVFADAHRKEKGILGHEGHLPAGGR